MCDGDTCLVLNLAYVPGLGKNLQLVSKMLDFSMKAEFDNERCLIMDKSKGYRVVFEGLRKVDLYNMYIVASKNVMAS